MDVDFSIEDPGTEMDHSSPCSVVANPSNINNKIAIERTAWPDLSSDAGNDPVLKLYNVCKTAGTHNVLGPQQSINTCNRIDAWQALSTGHSDDWWIIQCIRFGFPLQYRGPPLYNQFQGNHSSALQYDEHVNQYIIKEKRLGALAGPYKDPPFDPWCNISPILTREKAGKSERRIILDFSFPPEQNPNAYIPRNRIFGVDVVHTLPGIQDVLKIVVALQFDVMLASIDISRAYRNFAVDPFDWPLTCLFHNEEYYVDLCMPFGSRASSYYMQQMAEFIRRAFKVRGIITVIYLDDALFICPRGRDPMEVFSQAITLMRTLGLPLAWDKIIAPTRQIKFLGVIIDLEEREVRIPQNKIHQCLQMAREIVLKNYISKRQLQSIIGLINFIGKGVAPARLFINRLLHCLRAGEGSYIRVDQLICDDLTWFTRFLSDYNGRSIIPIRSPTLMIEVDSCLSGGGGFMGSQCYSIVYHQDRIKNMHISQLEAYNALIAARVFLSRRSRVCVEIKCDNSAAISCLSTGRGRDYVMMGIARAFWYLAAKQEVTFVFTHAPGTTMVIADALSREHLNAYQAQIAHDLVCAHNLTYVVTLMIIFKFRSWTGGIDEIG